MPRKSARKSWIAVNITSPQVWTRRGNPREGCSDRSQSRAPLPRGADWRRRLRGYAPLYGRGWMGDRGLIAIISQYKKTILWCFCPLKHIFLALSSANLLFFTAVLLSPVTSHWEWLQKGSNWGIWRQDAVSFLLRTCKKTESYINYKLYEDVIFVD